MRRREFITLAGSVAAAWPVSARGQQRPALPVVGFIVPGTPDGFVGALRGGFERGLKELGWIPGQNALIDYR